MVTKLKDCYWRQRKEGRGDMSDIMFQKSRIKVSDISQHTLQSRKINGQHGLLSKACLLVRFWLKCCSFLPLPSGNRCSNMTLFWLALDLGKKLPSDCQWDPKAVVLVCCGPEGLVFVQPFPGHGICCNSLKLNSAQIFFFPLFSFPLVV